ncbi:MAG: neutral/alkaline non-lysosomal ceramidase N-terminal domain-containing protein [Myxococcaceae bacterium]|jgi:neutral ceramidase|nr:neutral/alkaline non-lysosomal ceramidase N-terminal domain-containing protein [Myxococcaceae bacterium]MCA3012127.1 neutral/alkaline non-lysosomal ceramidase N-terminal domain-containing protein [Myxococcaceae bacterium]
MKHALLVVAVAGLSPGCGPSTPSTGPLRAGVATALVEVPVGAPTGGYSRSKAGDDPGSPWANTFPSTRGVHTDATARALALSNGVARVAFVRIDVCLITPSLRTRIRQLLDAAGEKGTFIVQATHTHGHVARFFEPVRIASATGPDFVALGMDTYDAELEVRIASAAVRAITDAFAGLVPVSVGSAVVDASGLNVDRRCENDPLYGPEYRDPSLTVVRFDEVDSSGAPVRPLTALTRFSVHGTVMSGANPLLTTDVTGAMELAASDALGVPVVFAQGAAGDVSPKTPALGFDGTQQLEWSGLEFARLAKQAFTEAAPGPARPTSTLRHVERGVLLTREALGYPRGQFPEYGGIGCMVGGKSCREPFQTPVDEGALLCGPVQPRPKLRTAVSLLELDDLAVVTLPGEVTTRVGQLALEALAPLGARRAMVFGYAQDHYGYLLEQDDFLRGGYEPTVSPWGWRMGQYLVGEIAALVSTRTEPQEKPTDAIPPEPTARPVVDSEAAPAIVTDTVALQRLETATFAFTGGDPGLGTPTVALEREEAGAFVPVKASPTRAVVNGPEIIRRYAATPTFAAQPMAMRRRHLWTASWETLPDTALGRYRLVATGRAQVSGQTQTFRLESAPFTVAASGGISALRARLVDGRLVLEPRFAPNPIGFEQGDPVRNLRVRDLESRPTDGALARGSAVEVSVQPPGGSPTTSMAAWDEARRGYSVELPAGPAGTWELSIAAGACTDRNGNRNRDVLRAQLTR